MVSSISKMNRSHDGAMGHGTKLDKNIKKELLVWKKIFYFVIRIFSYSCERAFDGASFGKKIKMLSFFQTEIFIKQKGLPNIFIMLNMVKYSSIIWCSFQVQKTSSEQVNRNFFLQVL
jgi:hypothetical protein